MGVFTDVNLEVFTDVNLGWRPGFTAVNRGGGRDLQL